MATYKADSIALRELSPPQIPEVNSDGGRIRFKYGEVTLAAAFGDNETIDFFTLPKGARIVNAFFGFSATLGADPDVDLGWTAGKNGNEVADPDGIFEEVGVTAAYTVALVAPSATVAIPALLGKKFADEVVIRATSNKTHGAGTGVVCRCIVQYVVD
jgi:hypothetical protein